MARRTGCVGWSAGAVVAGGLILLAGGRFEAEAQLKPPAPGQLTPTGSPGVVGRTGGAIQGGGLGVTRGFGGFYPGLYGGFTGYRGFGYGVYPGFGYGAFAPYGISSGIGYTGFGADVTGWGTGYGTGWGFGYGGWGGGAYGQTPYSLAVQNYQNNLLTASRYNLMNAEAVKNYQAANLFQQKALNEAVDRNSNLMDPRYPIATGAEEQPAQPRGRSIQLLPADQLVDRDGKVLWPPTTPSGEQLNAMRTEVDQAVDKVVDQARAGNRRPAIRDIVHARDALGRFAGPALNRLRSENPTDAAGLEVFLQSLDHNLALLGTQAAPAPVTAPPVRADLTPDDAPKSGGDILRDTVKDNATPESRSGADTIRPNDRPPAQPQRQP